MPDQEIEQDRCTKCNNKFLYNDHKHITRTGTFHTNCYKVNNLGYEQGQRDMKQRAIDCVPEKALNETSGDEQDMGFNDCREQTLQALSEI